MRFGISLQNVQQFRSMFAYSYITFAFIASNVNTILTRFNDKLAVFHGLLLAKLHKNLW